MKKIFNSTLFFAGVLAMGLVACDESDNQIAKPINKEAETTKSATDDSDLLAEQKARQERAERIERAERERNRESKSAQLPPTSIQFTEYEWDFGVINEGDVVEHVFKFTNTGSEPLILENCKGSCGCTVPECPKAPIVPGGSGEIKVVFNSQGKKNAQSKRVTVTANTEPLQTTLTIKAQVTPAS